MGLFPMCLSKIYSTHTFGREKEKKEKRKRREREGRKKGRGRKKKEKLGERPKSKPQEAIKSSTKLKEVRKTYFLYMYILGF